MKLDRLEVDHLRIIEHAALDPQPAINLFTGANGAGKTSLLEAVHLLVRGKSFRRGGLESQIRHASDAMAVRGRFASEQSTTRIDIAKSRGEPLELRRDRRRVERISEIVALIPMQTFLPDLADLIFGAPNERRKWLDLGLLYESRDSLRTMAHFRHVLRQRNAALRMRHLAQLDAWDFELAASAEAITSLRRKCFTSMAEQVAACAAQLCPELSVSVQFYPGHSGDDFIADLTKQRARDVQLRMTNAGPHRADIRVRISVDRASRRSAPMAAALVSQGQARALAAAFKLGQVQFLKTQGVHSVLLVDDLGSEWDAVHCDRFLALVTELGSQVLATAVSANLLPRAWQNQLAIYQLDTGRIVISPR